MKFTLEDISGITGSRVEGAPSAPTIDTLLTDSRTTVDPTTSPLFIALRTGSGDGHRFIKDAYRRGVRAFIVDEVPPVMAAVSDATFLVVPDTLEALRQLGEAARAAYKGTVIGVTGSRGKTQVKELLYAALMPDAWRSPRSWNSQIGVPLSLYSIDPESKYAIIEAGIDGPGQMEILARMIKPDLGIFTAVTTEHDAGFRSREQKINEKARLFGNCDVVVCDNNVPEVAATLRSLRPDAEIVDVHGKEQIVAHVLNILGKSIDERAFDAMSRVRDVSTRIDVNEGMSGSLVLLDNFTPDFPSLDAALDFMERRATAGRTPTLILGDLMHAAGATREEISTLYSKLALTLRHREINRLIGVGREIAAHRNEFDPLTASEFIDNADAFISRYSGGDFDHELILLHGDSKVMRPIKNMLANAAHDTVLEINLDAMVHNFNAFRTLLPPDTGIVAMVKASAYGIGSIEASKTLQSHGATYLAVAVVDEGVALRDAGITMPVMVMNPITTNFRALFNYHLEPSVFSLSELRHIAEEASMAGCHNVNIHIKLDTGMHRTGFCPEDIEDLVHELKRLPHIHVSSTFSHLATADCLDQDDYTQLQLQRFEEMSNSLAAGLGQRVRRHILNTAGMMRFGKQACAYDMGRLGIGLYGISPLPAEHTNVQLMPVATLSTTIIALRHYPAGTTVGYGRRGKLTRASVVATLPIGYADGIDRRLGCGAANFRVRGTECPTVGNICMDMCMIDVTDVPDVSIGDTVEIFGPSLPIERLAESLGTIPYEVLTSISPRVRRIYYHE
ncbi:MAG: alanine racemase [Muribaculaceae bacterium]|nr:alanine racemase [Muribaculaceae bacterium]